MNSQWKLVPVEPTETMVINGFESEPDECFTDEEVWEQYQEMSGCQQAAFRAKLCWAAMLSSAPVAPEGAKPVMKLEAEKLLGGHGEYALSFVRTGWLDECRMTGGEFLLYTHPDTGEVARLTAERDALQQRLNAADQRIDELTGAASRAAADIITERQRQITAEGHKPDRDDCYSFGELALAAAGYAASAGGARSIGRQLFRWDNVHWKPSTPRRDLVKAGALILAEIERIDRSAITHFPL